MQYNFIIVQHFVSSSDEYSEGNRLQSMYMPKYLPHLAIINPLTGSQERVLTLSEIETQERFLDGSMVSVLFPIVTAFLASCEIESLPSVAPPPAEVQTSNRRVAITPANTRPLRSSSWKRPVFSGGVSGSGFASAAASTSAAPSASTSASAAASTTSAAASASAASSAATSAHRTTSTPRRTEAVSHDFVDIATTGWNRTHFSPSRTQRLQTPSTSSGKPEGHLRTENGDGGAARRLRGAHAEAR